MNNDKLIITHPDGTKTEVEDPFRGMKSTYDALRADPNAIPELSDESRAAILEEIANGTAPAPAIETKPKTASVDNTYFKPNRHERRKQVAIARRERKKDKR